MGTLDELLERFTPEERDEIEGLTATWVALTELNRLREEQHISQRQMAGMLGVSQSRISRLERAEDLHLSTLRRYVETLGGRLRVEAVFPGDRVVRLSAPVRGASN